MSNERKPINDDTAMGKLKRLCRENPALRDELFALLQDGMKSAVWRAEVKKRFGVWFSADSQVTRWRAWVFDMMDQEILNDQMELRAERYRSENPGATPEEVRDDGIRYFMEQARARGDRKGFLDVATLDLMERTARTKAAQKTKDQELAERRVKLLEEKARQADAAKGILENKGLSDAQKRARMREVFGLS